MEPFTELGTAESQHFFFNFQDEERCKRMVTDNIIKCSKADMVGLDKDVGKEVKMLMNMIKKNKKKRKSRKKQRNKKCSRKKQRNKKCSRKKKKRKGRNKKKRKSRNKRKKNKTNWANT